MVILPLVGFINPLMRDRIVVLPQPLGPTILTKSPFFTSNEILSNAFVSPLSLK